MKPGIATVLLVSSTIAAFAAEEPPTLREGARVRIRASGREIPGILAIGRHEVTTKGTIVAEDDELVAVKVPEWPEPLCLPRPDETLKGRVVAMDVHGLTISIDGHPSPFRIPRAVIRSLDVSAGHANRGALVAKGAGMGFVVGAGLGAILGAASGGDCSADCWVDFDRGDTAVIGAIGLGVIGLAAGAVQGAARSTERWKSVPASQLHVRLLPVRGGARVSVAFAFR
jgi:hypothetical protein